VVGANRHSTTRDWFSGGSWIYTPQGDLLAETSQDQIITSAVIDLSQAVLAKQDYPVTMLARYGV